MASLRGATPFSLSQASSRAIPSRGGVVSSHDDAFVGKEVIKLKKEKEDVPEDYHFVYTKWITLKNGKRLFAKNYGRKCWRIRVRKK